MVWTDIALTIFVCSQFERTIICSYSELFKFCLPELREPLFVHLFLDLNKIVPIVKRVIIYALSLITELLLGVYN